MDEYISREETAKAFCEKCVGYYDGHCIHRVECDVDVIRTAPAADVEPVRHGRWILTNDENKKRCSECGIVHLIAQYPHGKANYCPHCGTKMDESERIRAEAEEDQFAAAGIGQAFNPGERGDANG